MSTEHRFPCPLTAASPVYGPGGRCTCSAVPDGAATPAPFIVHAMTPAPHRAIAWLTHDGRFGVAADATRDELVAVLEQAMRQWAARASTPAPAIDAGDVVRHRPTGEEWVVAGVNGDHLSWCGWPEGAAAIADCDLVEKATPEARVAMLRQWAAKDGSDLRIRWAKQALAAAEPTPDPDDVCSGCGSPWGMRHAETCRSVLLPPPDRAEGSAS